MDNQKQHFQTITAAVADHFAQFQATIQQYTLQLNTGRATTIDKTTLAATTTHEEFQKKIRSVLRQYRTSLEEAFRSLRESNANLQSSFRTFSEGGNFCNEEIVEYRTIIQALAASIDETGTDYITVTIVFILLLLYMCFYYHYYNCICSFTTVYVFMITANYYCVLLLTLRYSALLRWDYFR